MLNMVKRIFDTKYILWLVPMVLLMLFAWGNWYGKIKDVHDFWPAERSLLKADFSFENITYTRNIAGKTQWMLKAKTAELYQQNEKMDLGGVFINFFPKKGEPVSVVADKGSYDLNKEEIFLEGNVEVVSSDGRTLSTDTLHFSQKKRVIWTKDKVLLTGNGMVLKGKGLEYDLQKGKLVIKRQSTVLPDRDGFDF